MLYKAVMGMWMAPNWEKGLYYLQVSQEVLAININCTRMQWL